MTIRRKGSVTSKVLGYLSKRTTPATRAQIARRVSPENFHAVSIALTDLSKTGEVEATKVTGKGNVKQAYSLGRAKPAKKTTKTKGSGTRAGRGGRLTIYVTDDEVNMIMRHRRAARR